MIHTIQGAQEPGSRVMIDLPAYRRLTIDEPITLAYDPGAGTATIGLSAGWVSRFQREGGASATFDVELALAGGRAVKLVGCRVDGPVASSTRLTFARVETARAPRR